MAKNCGHIATKPHVTRGDSCLIQASDMRVEQHERGHEGSRKDRRGRPTADYGSGGWFESQPGPALASTGWDNGYDYEPGNVHWATRAEQN